MLPKPLCIKMNVFIVSLILCLRITHTLEASDFGLDNGNFTSGAANQTNTSMDQNTRSIPLKNIHDSTMNNSIDPTEKYVDFSDFVIDLTKTISSKLAVILREKVKLFLSKDPSIKGRNDSKKLEYHIIDGGQRNPKLIGTNSDGEDLSTFTSQPVLDSEKDLHRSIARQLVFHPYFPYGKDINPDEKISIHDVLPVKMVKFIKSMVEEAPWEAMFMKMVRMIVDQFVDKIIEKMFSHKEDEDDKWRSIDDHNSPSWSLLKKSLTSVIRLRRSISERKSEKESNWDSSSFSQKNRLSKNDEHKTKEAPGEESWLDSVLDFLFPEEDEKETEFDPKDRRKKRDLEQPIRQLRMEDIMQAFLMKYLDLSDGKTSPEKVYEISQFSRTSKNVSGSDNQLEDSTSPSPESSTEASTEIPSRGVLSSLPPRWSNLLQPEVLRRAKRSSGSDGKGKEMKRLWQESQRSRPSDPKTRDECSLRKACNAGRLLSRLPSVQDLTLQLKEYGNEPHWDALLWGMNKKKCSKIFCKRHRSPKGSKHSWRDTEKRYFGKHATHGRRTHKSGLS